MKVILKSLTREDRDYVALYAWGIIWALVFLVFASPRLEEVMPRPVVVAWLIITIAGAALAAAGVLLHRNLELELAGCWPLLAGPGIYSLAIGILAVQELLADGESPLLPWAVFAAWPTLFIMKRIRYLTHSKRLAGRLPTKSEARPHA